ncbi:MAG: ComF family protein [Bacteroidetes bacterium]|nr:ComF family protein [Bacteroidota bacterium]MBS1932645.1 ComF family protein [Bacteroidota bacterium]
MIDAKQIVHSLSHLFFPHTCAGCGSDLLNADQLLCLKCSNDLPLTHFDLYANNPIEKIFFGRCNIKNAMSLLYFTKDSSLQNLLHQLKYKGKKEIGFYFGKLMGNSILYTQRFAAIDALIPVPLFASREKRRGYNQATVLCDGIAEILKTPVLKNVLVRTNATETQTHKTRIERWQNMEGRFELKNYDAVANKHFLLVDDVITTGATLEACAQEILSAEGTKVSIATLAYTSA